MNKEDHFSSWILPIADKVLEIFECPLCSRLIRNQSMNQHQKQCKEKMKTKQEKLWQADMKILRRARQQFPCMTATSIIANLNKPKPQSQPLLNPQQLQSQPKSPSLSLIPIVQPPQYEPNSCPICMQSLEDLQEEQIYSLCLNGHFMHHACIVSWAEFKLGACPMCRQDVRGRVLEYFKARKL